MYVDYSAHVLFHVIADVDCPLPPQFANSILVTWHSDASSATAVYECDTGYQFSNGDQSKVYRCVNSLWSEPFVDCTSKCRNCKASGNTILKEPRVGGGGSRYT